MIGIIYKFTILTDKCFYVGQHSTGKFELYWGSGAVWRDMLRGLKNKYPNCWKKLVKREILWIGKCNQFTLDKLEEIYIRREHALYNEKLGGCNILKGTANNFGSGSPSTYEIVRDKISKSRKGKMCGSEHPMFGQHWSEEVKNKISKANKGKQSGDKHWHFGQHWSEEVKNKISKANKGKQSWLGLHHSEETKKKLSEHFTGKKWTEESKNKMSKTMLGAGNYMFGKIRITDGKVNKSIDKNSEMPEGFRRGCTRKSKNNEPND